MSVLKNQYIRDRI
jgi:transcriptional regulator with XRE-family HTH domain